jgi:hypothetical protein
VVDIERHDKHSSFAKTPCKKPRGFGMTERTAPLSYAIIPALWRILTTAIKEVKLRRARETPFE